MIAFVIERADSGALGVRLQLDCKFTHGLAIVERIRPCLDGLPHAAVARATIEPFFGAPGSRRWHEPLREALAPYFVTLVVDDAAAVVL